MMGDERDAVVKRVLREYWGTKEALAALEASLEEIATSSSMTTEDGYLMYSPLGVRLLDTGYVREQVRRYHAEKEHMETIRKRLIDLGELDPG
jgi:hypothetical protein